MDFTEAVFRERLGDSFEVVDLASAGVALRLDEVRALGLHSFALLFRGPLPGWLPQRTYRLRQTVMGEFDLFLVPLGPDSQGFRYEAIFNNRAAGG